MTDVDPPVAAAVIVHDDRVLLVKRRVQEGSLSWQFPAGAVEPGETGGQAATRETNEETGLTVTEARVLGRRVHPCTGRTMIYVACNLTSDDAVIIDDRELSDFRWLTHAQVSEYVPYGLFEPVQDYLDTRMRHQY